MVLQNGVHSRGRQTTSHGEESNPIRWCLAEQTRAARAGSGKGMEIPADKLASGKVWKQTMGREKRLGNTVVLVWLSAILSWSRYKVRKERGRPMKLIGSLY